MDWGRLSSELIIQTIPEPSHKNSRCTFPQNIILPIGFSLVTITKSTPFHHCFGSHSLMAAELDW